MNYKMVEKGPFHVAGRTIRMTTCNGENLKEIPKFWSDAYADGLIAKLEKLSGQQEIYGICMDFEPDQEAFTYMVAAEMPEGVDTGELEVVQIPAATWAVFESVGPMPDAIQHVWKRIFSEWFPATGEAPQLEVYPAGDIRSDDYRCQVWVPVRQSGGREVSESAR